MLAFIQFLVLIPAHAYLGLLTDGDILPAGNQSIGAESQFVFNKNDGINVAGHYAYGINDSLEVLADAGLGATDVYFGGNLKFVPIPDYESQPAIGFILGLTYANLSDDSFLTMQGKAFASKKFNFDYGEISPYVGMAYGVTMTNEDDADDPFHLILGAKYKHFEWQDLYLYAELGTSLAEAFNYISAKIVFPLGSSNDNLDEY